MRRLGFLRLAAVMLGALIAGSFLFVVAPKARADCGTASSGPCPTPTPTPVNAFISLNPTSGDPTTVITVQGGQFLPNEQMGLYWDQHPSSASATADAGGNFTVRVQPYPGDAPGLHRLCATVPPNPCANFTLQAPTPTPGPSPTPSESPTPTSTEASTAPINTNAGGGGTTLNGLDVITKPPFVFLPLTGAFIIVLSFIYWLFTVMRRPRRLKPIPTAAVVHRATRPDYSAGFGAPPASPAAAPEESAWAEPMPQASPGRPSQPAPQAPLAEPEPPPSEPQPPAQPPGPAWGPGEPDSGYPEMGPPGESKDWDLPGPAD